MAFKCMAGHAPEYLTSQFITREQVNERTTRSSQKLNIPLLRTASGRSLISKEPALRQFCKYFLVKFKTL